MDRWTAFEIGSNDCGSAMILRVPVQDSRPLVRLADRLPVRGHPAEPFSLAALHHAPTGADPFMHAMIRSTGVPIKRSIPLGIDVVGEHVSKRRC